MFLLVVRGQSYSAVPASVRISVAVSEAIADVAENHDTKAVSGIVVFVTYEIAVAAAVAEIKAITVTVAVAFARMVPL
jgi:hypothetical protein